MTDSLTLATGCIGVDLASERYCDMPQVGCAGGGMKQAVWLVIIVAAVVMLLIVVSDHFLTGALTRLLLLKN